MILFENMLRKQAMIPKFVHFEDKYIKNICVTKWGENGRLSLEKAYQIKELGDDFKEKTFGNFKELALFRSLNGGLSTSMTNNRSAFMNSHFDTIQLPEGLKIVPHSMFMKSVGKKVILPASIERLGQLAFKEALIDNLVILSNKVVNARTYWAILGIRVKGIYVQEHLIEEYKNTVPWSSVKKIIYPLNELSRL